jgi:TM2 domain-containing membrane protein YozV
MVKGVRAPLGALKTREVKSSRYKTSVPGAPDGEYVIIQFNTSFENKQSAVETVTPMREKDGSWRVSGYYIK